MNDSLMIAAGSLSVESPDSFTIFGRRHETSHGNPEIDGSILSAKARDLLAEVLYSTIHCCTTEGFSNPTNWSDAREFTDDLSAANSGTTSWQPGWVVSRVEPGQIVAAKHGVLFWIPDNDFRPSRLPVQVGDDGCARVPKECCNLMPGFYLAFGDSDGGVSNDSETVRVYWHLWSGGAKPLVETLTSILNRAGIPFALKLLGTPGAYPRSDAAVLYISASGYQQLTGHLPGIYRKVRPWLRRSVSALAKPLAPGLGLAEDPGDGSSFGQHRCVLLAGELSRAAVLSATDRAERLAAVLSRLKTMGWDPDRLYLNRGSVDRYPCLDAGELSGN